eukprot:7356898-Prymnesium_polylepis.1
MSRLLPDDSCVDCDERSRSSSVRHHVDVAVRRPTVHCRSRKRHRSVISAARCSTEGGWRWWNGAQERAWLTRRPLSLVHSTTRLSAGSPFPCVFLKLKKSS